MKKILLATLSLALSTLTFGRTDTPINDGWTIRPISNPNRELKPQSVTLPHTWNAFYLTGTQQYNREAYVYERPLEMTPQMQGRRIFLYFEGVNSVATVFVNRRSAGEHKGGYTAFCLEITDLLHPGENSLEVWASNAFRTDVLPISGDFNVYGGIHRPVRLIVCEPNCIDPTFWASSGVLVRQDSVNSDEARLSIETHLSLKGKVKGLTLRTMFSGEDNIVVDSPLDVSDSVVIQHLDIPSPHLWQAREDPFLYTVRSELWQDGVLVDALEQTTGLRSFAVDPERGFFLNGRPYDLHGFNRHEDFYGRGSALLQADYECDADLVDEVGATILRLAHYPHGEPIYRLCDERGVILWTEIPLCGPGGYLYTGYLKSVEDNAVQAAMELVYQKFNHPSVCFWGIFNELLTGDDRLAQYDDPVPFVRQLNELYHSLDPSRLTTLANCDEQESYVGCADLFAWNKYFNWTDSEETALKFFSQSHSEAGSTPVGVSEYGRGGGPLQHADPRHAEGLVLPKGYHPEEFQAICHEGYWKAFLQMPFLWTKIIWQFSDMQSCIKNEGDTPGRNDKGLVTYDRETRKDAFFFYKANWNPEPMLHLCSKGFSTRTEALTDIRAYSNLSEATLWVNGRKISTLKPDEIHRLVWSSVNLDKGPNVIKVTAKSGRRIFEEEVEILVK